MASFNDAIVKTLAKEGGNTYTKTANDRGGATKYGISQLAYPSLDIRNLTEQQARDIYKSDYWDRICGDDIGSQVVAENIFDTAVNMGVKAATKLAQAVCAMPTIDGIFGAKTTTMVNGYKDEDFICHFTLAKIARYTHICIEDKTQSKFLLGWITRALGGVV